MAAWERHHAPAAGPAPRPRVAAPRASPPSCSTRPGLRFADVDRIAVGPSDRGRSPACGSASPPPGAYGAGQRGRARGRLDAPRARRGGRAPRPPPATGCWRSSTPAAGEAFAAGWRDGAARAGAGLASARGAQQAAASPRRAEPWLAVGDGALRFRADLEGAVCTVAGPRRFRAAPASAPGQSASSRCRSPGKRARPGRPRLPAPARRRAPPPPQPRVT